MHVWLMATPGGSPAIEERARRLLGFEIGAERTGVPVTVATMFARFQYDPQVSAQYLMRIPPVAALCELAEMLTHFRIDGEPCPAPEGLARAALLHAGRAVDGPLPGTLESLAVGLRAMAEKFGNIMK